MVKGLDPTANIKGVAGGGAGSGQPGASANSNKEQRPGALGNGDPEPLAQSWHKLR
jgi:hypothetical protein